MNTRTTIGNNFAGAVRYQFEGRLDTPASKQALILFAEGVRTTSSQAMSADFAWGSTLNPNLSKPVWHTVIGFNPDDTPALTNEKMLAVAQDFRKEMGLLDTQCVIIRHFDKEDNEHLHILVNRVANDGHSIPDGRNFYRAKLAAVKLCEKHGLGPAAGQRPELQHPERIIGAYDRAGAEIRQALAYGLQTAGARATLWQALQEKAITVNESSRGVSFAKDGFTFKGSQIAREYSLGGIDKQLAVNRLDQVRRSEQQADAQENEQIRRRGQQVLTDLFAQKTFASYAELMTQLAAQGYVFVKSPEQKPALRHEVSRREFALKDVTPREAPADWLWQQADGVIEIRKAEELVRSQRAVQWEAARRETEQALTQVRDCGLRIPEEFFFRMRDEQPYDLRQDQQTQQITHVRHRASGEVFTWAQVQPGGAGAPPLAEQLAVAVQTERLRAAERRWEQDRLRVEGVIVQVQNERNFHTPTELHACLKARGVTWLSASADGQAHEFRLGATGEQFREKDVLRGGSMADVLAEAEARRRARLQVVVEQTKRDVLQTLHTPEKPLTGIKDYQDRLEARGYRLLPGRGRTTLIEHLTSGERLALDQVQPGGPAAAPLLQQVREVIAQRKLAHEIPTQATKDFEQVLAAKKFTAWPEYRVQIHAQGYRFVAGVDGRDDLLHEASRYQFPLAEVRPNGQDLTAQVNNVIADWRAEHVQGRIEVLADPQRSAAERAEKMRVALEKAGVLVNVTLPPANDAAGGVILTYTHAVRGTQLEEVNLLLIAIQMAKAKNVTVWEAGHGSDASPAAWPERRGEHAQATLYFSDRAAQHAAGGSVVAQLERTGALVRPLPSVPAGSLALEVLYHTRHPNREALTRLLDKWSEEGPYIQVRETERAVEVRGGQSRTKGRDYGYEM